MSVTVDMPPAIEQDMQYCIRQRGISLDANLLVYAADDTEDLNDGQIYCGMKAVDPFKDLG